MFQYGRVFETSNLKRLLQHEMVGDPLSSDYEREKERN